MIQSYKYQSLGLISESESPDPPVGLDVQQGTLESIIGRDRYRYHHVIDDRYLVGVQGK